MKWSNYGNSSLTLLAVHCGMDIKTPNIPYDPSDLKRCIHLFECLGWSPRGCNVFTLLRKTANQYPIWKVFDENWGELMNLWDAEKGQKSAPKLYEFMRKLVKQNPQEKGTVIINGRNNDGNIQTNRTGNSKQVRQHWF